MIKRLFSIEIESDLSHSMKVNTMVRPAVRAELAVMFDCPQVSGYFQYRYSRCSARKIFISSQFNCPICSYPSNIPYGNSWPTMQKCQKHQPNTMRSVDAYRQLRNNIKPTKCPKQSHSIFQLIFGRVKCFSMASNIYGE